MGASPQQDVTQPFADGWVSAEISALTADCPDFLLDSFSRKVQFKSFPVETDENRYSVLRYVERNALRANLVARAEDRRWGSLWSRQLGDAQAQELLHPWPTVMPENRLKLVNAPETEGELEAVRRALARGSPFGSPAWCERTASQLDLQATLRPPGRPRKKSDEGAPSLF